MIRQQVDKLRRLVNYASHAVFLALIESSDFIESLNTAQLSEGLRSDGSALPDYAPGFGKTGRIKLFDTGDFWRGIETNLFDDKLVLIGTDEKTEMLQERYGINIIGLSEESISMLIVHIKPIVLLKMREFKDRL